MACDCAAKGCDTIAFLQANDICIGYISGEWIRDALNRESNPQSGRSPMERNAVDMPGSALRPVIIGIRFPVLRNRLPAASLDAFDPVTAILGRFPRAWRLNSSNLSYYSLCNLHRFPGRLNGDRTRTCSNALFCSAQILHK